MKNGGLILWNAIAFCEMSKTSWQKGKLRLKHDLAQESKVCLSVFAMVSNGVDTCEVAQCRFDDGCWRPLCPYRHSGRGQAAMWVRVWLTLAALAPQESTRRQEPECEAEVPEIFVVSDAVDGTSVDLDDEGVDVPEETAELVKLVSQERVQQRTAEMPVDLVKLVSQERVQRRTAEVPVEVVSLVSQERVQQRTAEVPVEVVSLVSQDRVQQRIAEAPFTGNFPQERISERTQIVDEPVPQIWEDFTRECISERITDRRCASAADFWRS